MDKMINVNFLLKNIFRRTLTLTWDNILETHSYKTFLGYIQSFDKGATNNY